MTLLFQRWTIVTWITLHLVTDWKRHTREHACINIWPYYDYTPQKWTERIKYTLSWQQGSFIPKKYPIHIKIVFNISIHTYELCMKCTINTIYWPFIDQVITYILSNRSKIALIVNQELHSFYGISVTHALLTLHSIIGLEFSAAWQITHCQNGWRK